MLDSRQTEIDRNYDVFQRKLGKLLPEHRGEFALMRSGRIIGFFEGPGEAYRAGLQKYDDELFSIQEVEDRPAEMGLVSLALD